MSIYIYIHENYVPFCELSQAFVVPGKQKVSNKSDHCVAYRSCRRRFPHPEQNKLLKMRVPKKTYIYIYIERERDVYIERGVYSPWSYLFSEIRMSGLT